MDETLLYSIENDYSLYYGNGTLTLVIMTGAVGWAFYKALLPHLKVKPTRPNEEKQTANAYLVFSILGSIILFFTWTAMIRNYINRSRMTSILAAGKAEIIEGTVTQVSSYSAESRSPERIIIADHVFEYSPNNLMQPGLRAPGLFREGMFVRVWHFDEAILKVESLQRRNAP